MASAKHSLLFLGKADDLDCARALDFCRAHFAPLTACLGRWGDPIPPEARDWQGDYIISYLSRWVVPADLLQHARGAAINFHPASPEYPGIGCNNFALYEGATHYGVTCHHMAPKVDSGAIVAVRRFPIYPEDNVATLLERTYANQIALFFEIADSLAEGEPLPVSSETWTRPPFTRKQFDELFRLTPDMPVEELARRIRAVSFGEYQPYIEVGGYRFVYKPSK